MKTIIAGSRGIDSFALVADAAIDCGWAITEVVSGCARGVDRLGERWANVFHVPVRRFPARWWRDGRAAGVIRNQAMAEYAESAVLIWDGHSRGTADMHARALKRGLRVFMVDVGVDWLRWRTRAE